MTPPVTLTSACAICLGPWCVICPGCKGLFCAAHGDAHLASVEAFRFLVAESPSEGPSPLPTTINGSDWLCLLDFYKVLLPIVTGSVMPEYNKVVGIHEDWDRLHREVKVLRAANEVLVDELQRLRRENATLRQDLAVRALLAVVPY